MLTAAALVKDFVQPGGAALRAVDGLSFEVAPGETYGLLGPNGAGKTTAMRMLAPLLRPTSATAFVFLLTSHALGEVALIFAILDLGIVLWANRLFDRERLLSRR
jgi:ABC-type multidrug transport system ATPase subunit